MQDSGPDVPLTREFNTSNRPVRNTGMFQATALAAQPAANRRAEIAVAFLRPKISYILPALALASTTPTKNPATAHPNKA